MELISPCAIAFPARDLAAGDVNGRFFEPFKPFNEIFARLGHLCDASKMSPAAVRPIGQESSFSVCKTRQVPELRAEHKSLTSILMLVWCHECVNMTILRVPISD